jgi:hypothetical protein
MVGISVELFGFINLFGDFFPVILGFLRQLPFIGPVLRAPYIGPVFQLFEKEEDVNE